MRLVELRKMEHRLSALVAEAQHQRVLLTRDGHPAAVLIGVEGQDPESISLTADARVWRWLEARGRGSATICLAEVEARYLPGGRPSAVQSAEAGCCNEPSPEVGRRAGSRWGLK